MKVLAVVIIAIDEVILFEVFKVNCVQMSGVPLVYVLLTFFC